MAVGLMIVTHAGVGSALLNAALGIVGDPPLPVALKEVPRDSDLDAIAWEVEQRMLAMDATDGHLFLVDIFGATPSNVAMRMMDTGQSTTAVPRRLVSGVNLPMLVKVFNYAGLSLDELAEKAREAGHEGVIVVGGC